MEGQQDTALPRETAITSDKETPPNEESSADADASADAPNDLAAFLNGAMALLAQLQQGTSADDSPKPSDEASDGGDGEEEDGATAAALTPEELDALVEKIKRKPTKVLRAIGGSFATVRDTDGRTLSHVFASLGQAMPFLLEFVLQNGSPVETPAESEWMSPLQCAAMTGSVECCELLVRYGAKTMKDPEKARRVLMDAVVSQDEPTMLFIISQGGGLCTFDPLSFRLLCVTGYSSVVTAYLDLFRLVPSRPRQTSMANVYYHDLHLLYGPPWLPVTDTPLHHILDGIGDVPSALSHPLVDYLLDAKWAAFARNVFVVESVLFLLFLGTTYWLFVDGWYQSGGVANTVVGIIAVLLCLLFLALEAVDWRRRGRAYWRSFSNWIHLSTYLFVLALLVLLFFAPTSSEQVRAVEHATAIAIVLLCSCGVEW
ncbi:hypothetical protein ATCC90586_010333 [Pythium insidiosum]|nr:hypothetical protein ATCC90586_010333 [Pythium insidiosum]